MGLKVSEVEAYIQESKDQIEEKDKTIKELENRIRRLEFDKDDLATELNVYKMIHASKTNEKNEEKA